jgi:hypothetical protein
MASFLDKSTQAFAKPSQPVRSKLVKVVWNSWQAAMANPILVRRRQPISEGRIVAQWIKHWIQPE